MSPDDTTPAKSARRDFLVQACAVAVGSATVIVPIGAGLSVLLDPLRRKSEVRDKIFITTLGAAAVSGARNFFDREAVARDGLPWITRQVAAYIDIVARARTTAGPLP